MRHPLLPLALAYALAATAQHAHRVPTLTMAVAPGAHPHAPAASMRGAAPPNDLCTGANIVAVPAGGTVTVTGDNTGSTDTEDFGNPNCWEAFSIDTCSTVTVSYCGTNPVFGIVYSILLIGCPQPDVSVQNGGTADCGDGNTTITYPDLAAGTYYIPVLLWPGQSEGPYSITIGAEPCSAPPPNDRCINAIPVQVVEDCAQGTVTGNNALALQQGAGPACATTSTQFQDVWYTFNSGTHDQVVIAIGVGTIGDLGVEVRDACGGNVVLCGVGDTSYTVNVAHNVDHKVRVFSNNDLGLGGTFTICVTVPPPASQCDGGHVSLLNGDTTLTICNDEPPFDIFVNTAATVNYTLFLTDAEDTVLEVLTGTTFDPSGLLPGTYHIHGISHLSVLVNAAPGVPIDSVRSIGACAERSDDHITLTKDICQGLDGRIATVGVVWDAIGGCFLIDRRASVTDAVASIHDVTGRTVAASPLRASGTERWVCAPLSHPVPGLYVVGVNSSAGAWVGRVLVH